MPKTAPTRNEWQEHIVAVFECMPDPSILAENFDIEAAHAKLEPAIHHLSRMRQMAYDERSVDKLRALQAMQEEFRNVSQAIMGLMQNRRARSGIVLPEARA